MTSLQIFRLITMAEAKEQRNGEFAVFVMTFPPFKPIRYQLSIAHEPSHVQCGAGSRLVWRSWVLAFWQRSWYSPPPVPASWLAGADVLSVRNAIPSWAPTLVPPWRTPSFLWHTQGIAWNCNGPSLVLQCSYSSRWWLCCLSKLSSLPRQRKEAGLLHLKGSKRLPWEVDNLT